jgi:hypothetical protein
MAKVYRIWEFEDAPEEYRKLSEHGGDEDFIVELPEGITQDDVRYRVEMMIERLTVCDAQWRRAENGRWIVITAHA